MRSVKGNVRIPCIVGNWKMHGTRVKSAELFQSLLDSSLNLESIEVVVCPPFVYLQYLEELRQLAKRPNIFLGAQNVFAEKEGAFTGEISCSMLVDLNCRYVILGHSERRRLLFESDELIARKVLAAYHAGLIPILCVGETLTEREAGRTMEIIKSQITKVLDIVDPEAFQKVLIAYEPIWAIGTGVAASPDQAEEVHAFIRSLWEVEHPTIAKALRILYGGSVKKENAQDLFAKPNIDGALIGGASLNSEDFLTICDAAISRTVWNNFY